MLDRFFLPQRNGMTREGGRVEIYDSRHEKTKFALFSWNGFLRTKM
jgi:hypothetical protein